MVKGEEVSLAICQIPWYNVELSIQKDVMLMIMRSQKDMKLQAFNMFIYSHDTFKVVSFEKRLPFQSLL